MLIVCPPLTVSTAEIFRQWGEGEQKPESNRLYTIINAIKQQDINHIAACFYNGLTGITARIYPEITDIVQSIKTAGAVNAAMSGSGPSVFGYFTGRPAALKARRMLKSQFPLIREIYVTNLHHPKDETI
jgi:4-diphosphocytidyl-2-C-methyl-D-erythritol kinase